MITLQPLLPYQHLEFDPLNPVVPEAPCSVRRLSDLGGYFTDDRAYQEVIDIDDPVIYKVYSIGFAEGAGNLHYGFGIIMPGKIGSEYYLTKGHLHAHQEAAEIYIGLSGEGMMLLEEENGESRLAPLRKNSIIYVPGYTAHRTINVGDVPLTYIGIYPANAGHDYGFIKDRGFSSVLIEKDGVPTLIAR